MNLNEYQTLARGTALPTAETLNYLMPGLAGEAGEVAEFFYETEVLPERKDDKELLSELADVCWFIALIADIQGWSLEDIVLDGAFDSFEQYQNLAHIDAPSYSTDLLLKELGMHVGDVQSAWAKSVRDNYGSINPEKEKKIQLGLANTFWSVARIASNYGVDVLDILQSNIDKLYDRKSRGVLGGSGNNR